MSDTLVLAILSISELALITTGVAVFLFLRNRRLSQMADVSPPPAPDHPPEPVPELKFADHLQQNIEQTQQKLAELPEEQAKILEMRLNYLQAEVNAQEHCENETAYWEQLISAIDNLLPDKPAEDVIAEPVDKPDEEEPPVLNELDDIDIHDSFDEIPVLEDHVGEPGEIAKESTASIDTAHDDIERLRQIISRQHDTMDGLKKSLQEKGVDLESNQELCKKLEEIEIAQAQLNMCVETLEKENERLNVMIKDYEDSPHQEQLTQAKQELHKANDRINTLEKENSQQAERISDLESEIAELEKTLQQRTEALARAQNLEADLSLTQDDEEASQDSLMKEIESLTELITQKSEELSKLQSINTDEFDFESELPELDAEDSPSDKAAHSG